MTIKPIDWAKSASRDVEDAAFYYVEQSGEALSLEFADTLQDAVQRIQEMPEIGSLRFSAALEVEGLRVWPLKRFPYTLYYMEFEDRFLIARVLHERQDLPSDPLGGISVF